MYALLLKFATRPCKPICIRFTGILEQGVHIESLNMSRSFTTYESNVLFALRFMIDHEVVGGNWVELPAGHHTYLGPATANKLSHCQMEAHIHCSKVISHKPEGRRQQQPSFSSCLLYYMSGCLLLIMRGSFLHMANIMSR